MPLFQNSAAFLAHIYIIYMKFSTFMVLYFIFTDVTCNYALPMQQSVMLDCDNDKNVLIPSSSEWYFTSHFSVDVANEIKLNPSGEYDIERHQLFIRNATINDTGIYRCTVNSSKNMSFAGDEKHNLTVLHSKMWCVTLAHCDVSNPRLTH